MARKRAYLANPDLYAARHRKKTYQLDEAAYGELLATQDGKCAICAADLMALRSKARHIDHCHVTGKVRGLLCHHCNVALGSAEDDPERLRAMAAYIERHAVVE